MPTLLQELHGKLTDRRTKIADLMKKTETVDGVVRRKWDAADLESFKSLTSEVDSLAKEWEQEREIAEAGERNAKSLEGMTGRWDPAPFAGTDGARLTLNDKGEIKSLGRLLVESPQFKSWHQHGASGEFRVTLDGVNIVDHLHAENIKTLMTVAAGYAPARDRTDRVVLSAQRRPMVADLVPQDPTTLDVIRYLEETTFTNNAAVVAEGATKPESALVLTERSNQVEVIATTLPITEQQLADVPQVEAYVKNRLGLQVALAEEIELLNGDGTPGSHLQGFLTKSGIGTTTQAVDEDVPDTCLRALVAVQYTGFADLSGWVFNPTDWWVKIRLMRTSDGIYIWGNPSEMGPQRLWGAPAVVTPAITVKTVLGGDFQMYSHISRRMGLTIATGWVNDDFKKNIRTLRAEERLALEIYRAAAFNKITLTYS